MKKMFYLLMLGVFSTYYSFGQIVISSDPVYPQIVFRNTTTNTDRALYSDGEQSGILKYRYDGTNDVYLMHSGNFNSYVPTLTGTGASGNWNINAASATNTTYWGNIGADFANGPGGSNLAWIAAADGTAGTVRPYFAPAIRTWLGIPSGGETLQSVMDRGRVFSGEMLNNTSVGRKFTAYSDAGGFASFGQDYNRAFLSATANDRITLGHIGIDGNYQEKFSVLPNGNVGIGTTSPGFKLDIRNASSDGIRVSTTDNQYVGALLWNSGTVDLSAGGYGTPDLRLMTDGSERLRVLSNGNIGIGTSSPSEKLSVNGNIRTNNNFL
jgi:hypothetical protein